MLSGDEVAGVSALSEDELLIEIGTAIQMREGLSGFPSRRIALQNGRDWFERFLNQARKAICGDPHVRAAGRREGTLPSKLIELVATAIANSALSPPCPVATVSAVVVRRGIDHVCLGALRPAQHIRR